MTKNNQPPPFDRRSDLDALRAVAMLLGIVLHASLAFFPSFWSVADRRQLPAMGIIFAAIHGFRMPVFFVMSGFFTAMLTERRGIPSMLKHRFRRVFLPLLLGMVTVIPATNWISSVATRPPAGTPGNSPAPDKPETIWTAAASGNLDAIERYLAGGTKIDARDDNFRMTPLHHASLSNRPKAVELLIQRGADVNATAIDGGTPLHAAAFVGNDEVIKSLITHGANLNARNGRGNTPLDNATVDEGTTLYFASLLNLPIDKNGLRERKESIADYLRDRGAPHGESGGITRLLMEIPVFGHLWFLWFLCWLVIGLAMISALAARLPSIRVPHWLITSPVRYLWLVPLTMIPQAYMGAGGTSPGFGPDTSLGLLPVPHVLFYYAIFFGFGALYYRSEDRLKQVGSHWMIPLVIGLLIMFPLGFALTVARPDQLPASLAPSTARLLSIGLQAVYPWLMTFGLMGLFQRFCTVESSRMRYLSDSAYWLYLTHLPLVIAVQYFVRDWPLPALVKLVFIVLVVTGFLLWTYQAFVRYTWLGRILNGPRVRPEPTVAS